MQRIAYVNGGYCPIEEARVSILDRGFLFADGIYEVTAVIDGKLVDYPAHMARLQRSLREIRLTSPVSEDALRDVHLELIRRNALAEGGIYLQITRGAADRDFKFPKDVPATVVLFTQARNMVNSPDAETGIAVKTVPDIRWARRDIKSVALLAQVLAKQAAAEAGCGEAWMIEEGGYVTEGGSSSAFILTKAGSIIARPLSNDILPGITRIAMLKLAEEMQLRIEERRFTLQEALDAAEAFNTAAGALIMPVVRIDEHVIGDGAPGPVVRRLRQLYIEHARATGIPATTS